MQIDSKILFNWILCTDSKVHLYSGATLQLYKFAETQRFYMHK